MKRIFFTLLILIPFLPNNVFSSDWQEQGIPVNVDPSNASNISMISDGQGGAIMTWIDGRYNGSVFTQRVSTDGKVLWNANGVAVCTVSAINPPGSYFGPRLVTDGSGGAIIAWPDKRGGTYADIYAQRINASGSALWAANGVLISNNPDSEQYVELTTDGAGGAIISWTKFNGVTFNEIYAQRINSAGTVQWTANGVKATCADKSSFGAAGVATTDGSGGVIIGYGMTLDGVPNGRNVYAQRINSSGVPQWGFMGVTISAQVDVYAQDIRIATDGAGGAILAWNNYATEYNALVQRVNGSGVKQWGTNGILAIPWVNINSELISDGAGGAILTMFKEDVKIIFGQRISPSGILLWNQSSYGAQVDDSYYNQHKLVSDGEGGAYFSIQRAYPGLTNADIIAQKVDGNGERQWAPSGVTVCVRDGSQSAPGIVQNEKGSAIIAWIDDRNLNWDIYSQKVKPLRVVVAEPTYGLSEKTFNSSIAGAGFMIVPDLLLRKAGGSQVTASNKTRRKFELLDCTFDTTGLLPGVYDVVAAMGSYEGILKNGFRVLERLTGPLGWKITNRGQLGNPSLAGFFYSISIADGDNDNYQEIFVANRDQKIFYLECLASSWTTTSLPATPLGEYCSSLVVCDADHDDSNEVYVATLSNNVYQLKSPSWTKVLIGSSTERIYSLAYGDPDEDGEIEVYAACADGNIYQYKEKVTWQRSTIATGPSAMYAIKVGDGNSDGEPEIFTACADNKIYQYKYNGTSWASSIVGSGSGEMYAVAVGDGNKDGQKEVYGANEDGKVYQFKWLVSSWASTEVGNSPGKMYGVEISDGENQGEDSVFSCGEDGHVYQFKANGSSWNKNDLGSASTPLYKLAVGDGDNDYRHEIYAVGEDNHVYEFKAQSLAPTPVPTMTPTATQTPISNFRGQIISENYIYAAPNPIRGHVAKIHIMTLQPAEVTVKVFTTTNKEVMSFNRNYSQGMQIETVNMSNLANGVYFLLVKARANNGLEEKVIKKIALIK